MVDFIVGLDFGQAADYTALAVLERGDTGPDGPLYRLRHLQRWPLGTPYTTIVPDVSELVMEPPLKGHCQLVVDKTGVGRPLVEMLRQERIACRIIPVVITAGHQATVSEDNWEWHVPKKELVTSLQLVLQGRRLKIAKSLPFAAILGKELANFKVKITASANETFEAWREGDHDDLVLATAMAVWLAEREPRWGPKAMGVGSPLMARNAPAGVFGGETSARDFGKPRW